MTSGAVAGSILPPTADPRPAVREAIGILGNLLADFDFRQKPRPAMLLALHPPRTCIHAMTSLNASLQRGITKSGRPAG